MMSTVIGGAMLPHAPQFFTMPETEDKTVVAHVRIIFSNDHAEQFFHTTAPPFTIHVGGEASGEFAGRKFHWKIPSEIGFELVRQLYRQNFDPAFTSTAKIDYAIGISADLPWLQRPGAAYLRERLFAAGAHHGALLRL